LNLAYYPISKTNPGIDNIDLRLQLLDKFGVTQILVPTGPPLEAIAEPKKAAELARVANDSMAEIAAKYPEHFPAAIALVPTNNIEAALDEIDRCIKKMKFKGIYLYTPQIWFGGVTEKTDPSIKGINPANLPLNTRPLDLPELFPLYTKMVDYDLPIWIHPRTTNKFADYTTESVSKNRIWQIFGWPYQTTAAMTRLIFSGIFEKYPNIKFVTHHAGGMVPFYKQRIKHLFDYDESAGGGDKQLINDPIENYRKFYVDTAVNGSADALMCAYKFYGAGKMLFGTDVPHDRLHGEVSMQETIQSIEQMEITEKEKGAIFEDNIKILLNLDI
jgi:uncharacterized protein